MDEDTDTLVKLVLAISGATVAAVVITLVIFLIVFLSAL